MGTTLHELERLQGRDLAADDYWAQARLSILRDWVDRHHPQRILDVGCGSGYLADALARDDRRVVGLDIDPESIHVAEERDSAAEFIVGDARDMTGTVADESVDTAILADLIEHFEDPVPVLKEAERVVTADGRVLVSVPANPWLYGPHDENQGHARRYTPAVLRQHAESAGLREIRHRHTNFFPLPVYGLLQRVLKRDVPESVRGGHDSRLVNLAKRVMLGAERRIRWPVGVTLLAEFTPARESAHPKVLMTNYEYPPACGGGGVFTRDLRDALRERDYEVELVAGRSASALHPNGVLDLMTYPLRSATDLRRVIKHTDPDVLNGHFSVPSSLLLPYFKRKTGIPYVVNVMGADIHDPTRYGRLRPALDLVNYRGVLEHADALVVPSGDMYDRLPERFHDKTAIIPYFVDTDRFSPSSVGDIWGTASRPQTHLPVRLLTVARLVPRKNLETALAVVRALKDFGVPTTYTIVGQGSQFDPLKKRAAALGIANRVDFLGYVPDADLPGVYRDHDIFLLPSWHEAFGIVILEAMASGLPVVTSNVGGQRDIVTPEVGALCEPTAAIELARAITTIQGDYEAYSHAARARAADGFSEDAVVSQYETLFSEVAE